MSTRNTQKHSAKGADKPEKKDSKPTEVKKPTQPKP